jgi:hypothetical protein
MSVNLGYDSSQCVPWRIAPSAIIYVTKQMCADSDSQDRLALTSARSGEVDAIVVTDAMKAAGARFIEHYDRDSDSPEEVAKDVFQAMLSVMGRGFQR